MRAATLDVATQVIEKHTLSESGGTDVIEKRTLSESVGGPDRSAVVLSRTGSVPVRFAKQLAAEIWADNIDDVGAMMTYYAILALFPMLVFVLTIGMLVLDHETIRQGVMMATNAMPESARELVAGRVQQVVDSAHPGFAIGSALFALWGASRGASAFGGALNAILQKTETRSWVRRQLIAIAVTLVVAVLMVVALGLLVVGPAIGRWLSQYSGLGEAFDIAWSIGRWVGAGVLVMFVWALLYKTLPNTRAPLRVFTPGAFIGVLLWLGMSYLFGVYLSHWGSYEATYGTFGTVIVFLTWMWLSNIALLVGAEINDVLADLRKHRSSAAAQLADPHERPV